MTTGGEQEQADGAASYPIPLCAEYPENSGNLGKSYVVYRTSLEADNPAFPCEGNVNNPEAAPGYACFYRGEPEGGLEVTNEKNAKFSKFQDAAGNNYQPACTAETEFKGCPELGGLIGELIVFRTTTFVAATPKTVAANAYLTASGSWAVRAR